MGFFLPKSKFAIQVITYYFSSEAHFCPPRLLSGDTDRCRAAAGTIELEVASHVLFHTHILYIYIYLAFHLPISFTPPREEGKKNPPNPNSESFVFVSMGILQEGGRV